MIRSYRYRLYPTDEQKAYFAKAFGCCRYAYNFCVREHKRMWKEEKKTVNEYDLTRLMTLHKQDVPWLNEADSAMLRWAAMRVINGYDLFFNSIQRQDKHTYKNPPHEHKKGERSYQSYTTSGVGLKVFFKHNIVCLPIVGYIRAVLHRRFYGQIKNATIKQTASGKYYVSLCVETREGGVPMKHFNKEDALGIDLGVRHFATLSDGTNIEMPDISRSQNRRAFLQRRLKQQKEGSNGYNKTKKQIARLCEHIANVRLDFHHKTAVRLCSEHSAICMETLNAEEMLKGVGEKKEAKDNGFNRQLKHVGISQFSRIIEEKAARTGTHFTRIDRWEPTTKRCHVCGYINKEIVIGVEEWACPECHTLHDRDINAAINIKNHAVEQQPVIKEEKPLDDALIKKQLPMEDGKVRSAKADGNTGRRTEKMADLEVCQPSTQIEDGSTPPRLASMRGKLYRLRLHPFARRVNIPSYNIIRWCYGNVKYYETEDFYRFLDELLTLAKECRHLRIYTSDRLEVADKLLKMNKYVDMCTFTEEIFHYGKPFTWWRTTRRSEVEVAIINNFYTKTLPGEIEDFVAQYWTKQK